MGRRWRTLVGVGAGLLLCALGYGVWGPAADRRPDVTAEALPDTAPPTANLGMGLAPEGGPPAALLAAGRAAVAAAGGGHIAPEGPAGLTGFHPQPPGGRLLLVQFFDRRPVAGARVVLEPSWGLDLQSLARMDTLGARIVAPGESPAGARSVQFLADELGQVRLPAWAEVGRLRAEALRDGVLFAGERVSSTRPDATPSEGPIVLRLFACLAIDARVVDRFGAPKADLGVGLFFDDRAEPFVVATADVEGRVRLVVPMAAWNAAAESARLRVLALFEPPVELALGKGTSASGGAHGPHTLVLPEHGAVHVIAVGSPSAGPAVPTLPRLGLVRSGGPAAERVAARFEGNTGRFEPVGLGLELRLRANWPMESRSVSVVLAGPTSDGEVVRHSLEPARGVVNVRLRILDAAGEPLVRRHVLLIDQRSGLAYQMPVQTGDEAELYLAARTEGGPETTSFVLEHLGALGGGGQKTRQRARVPLADRNLASLPVARDGARDLGDVRLEAVRMLSTGWVEDVLGHAVDRVVVRAEAQDTSGRGNWSVVATAESDEDGRFEIEDRGTQGPFRLIARRGNGVESAPHAVQHGERNIVLKLLESASFSAFVRVHEDLSLEFFSSELFLDGKPPVELALRNPSSHDFARLARGGALWLTSRAAVPVGRAEWVLRSQLGGRVWHRGPFELEDGDDIELDLVDLEAGMGLGALEFVRADGNPVMGLELRAVDPNSGALLDPALRVGARVVLPLSSEPLEIEARAAGTSGARIALSAMPLERIERRILLEPNPEIHLVLPAGPWNTRTGVHAVLSELPGDSDAGSPGRRHHLTGLAFDKAGRAPFPLRWPGRYRVDLLSGGEPIALEFELDAEALARGGDVELGFDPAAWGAWIDRLATGRGK